MGFLSNDHEILSPSNLDDPKFLSSVFVFVRFFYVLYSFGTIPTSPPIAELSSLIIFPTNNSRSSGIYPFFLVGMHVTIPYKPDHAQCHPPY